MRQLINLFEAMNLWHEFGFEGEMRDLVKSINFGKIAFFPF